VFRLFVCLIGVRIVVVAVAVVVAVVVVEREMLRRFI